MFCLHEKAIENINDSANSLIDMLTEMKLPSTQQSSVGTDLYSSATIKNENILDMKYSLNNMLGEEVCRFFFKDGAPYGLVDENYQKYCIVAQKIYKHKSISDLLSLQYIKERLFTWIEKKVTTSENTDFYDYLSNVCKVDVADQEVIIPVPFTLSNKNFQFGKITFKTVTEKMIDDWIKQANENNTEVDEGHSQRINQLKVMIQKSIQGYLAGHYICKAEKQRAQEMAYEEFSKTLCFLRLLGPANFHYKVNCATHEYGKNFSLEIIYLVINKENGKADYNTQILNSNMLWNIDEKIIEYISSGPFLKVHNLLLSDSLSEYKSKLQSAIMIYSKSVISHEIYDKILYILVAIETMLLKTDTEPIQQNIGQRLSFLVGNNLDERKKIIKTIKDIYSIRSKYIHHGIIDFEDDELMRNFMNYAWIGFSRMLDNMDKFSTKMEFVEYLDNLLLS